MSPSKVAQGQHDLITREQLLGLGCGSRRRRSFRFTRVQVKDQPEYVAGTLGKVVARHAAA